jgi:hypothetical protein
MHDLLEGGLHYETKLMLNKFVTEEKYFSLDDLNFNIDNFGFGYMEVTNRPTPITHQTLTNGDNSLKQNGMYYCSYSTFISIVYLLKLPKCGSSAEVCR